MKNYAIISEFNPFHNGHAYLVKSCREHGATHITAVMSGNFVQRGEPAIFPKHIRTLTALKNGVDLVIELHLPFAVSNAQQFAENGTSVADAMNCVDCIAFGSECGDISSLNELSSLIISENFQKKLKKQISTGISYPSALTNTMKIINPSLVPLMSEPNNILGIEYIKAVYKLGSPIKPVTFKRIGDSYNDTSASSEFASAASIRRLIYENKSFKKYVPENSVDILLSEIEKGNIASLSENERGFILKLRQMSANDIADIADVNEGLENRIKTAVMNSTSLEKIIERTKSKRYTYARIRRILLACLLNIKKSYLTEKAPYIRVLGFNSRGAEILSCVKQKSVVPLITKIRKAESLSPAEKAFLALEINAGDIYYTFTKNIKPCGEEYRNGIVIIK